MCGSPRLCRRRERLIGARFGRWREEGFGRARCLTLRYSLLLSVWVDPSAEHIIYIFVFISGASTSSSWTASRPARAPSTRCPLPTTTTIPTRTMCFYAERRSAREPRYTFYAYISIHAYIHRYGYMYTQLLYTPTRTTSSYAERRSALAPRYICISTYVCIDLDLDL